MSNRQRVENAFGWHEFTFVFLQQGLVLLWSITDVDAVEVAQNKPDQQVFKYAGEEPYTPRSYSHPAGCVDLCGIESAHVSHADDAHLDLVIPFEARATTSTCERHRELVVGGADGLSDFKRPASAVPKGKGAGVQG